MVARASPSIGRLSLGLALAALCSCEGSGADAEAAAQLQETISHVDQKLAALDDRLAQIEARAAEVAQPPTAVAPPSPRAPTTPSPTPLPVLAEPDHAERIEVVVTPTAILIGGKEVAMTELPRIFEATASRARATVVIQADRDVEYPRIVEVMDAAKLAGITQLGITKPTSSW